MNDDKEKQEYKNSTIWGIIFIVIFFIIIGFAIWAVVTGNYNTPN